MTHSNTQWSELGSKVNLAVYLVLIYLWRVIATPEQRFPILGELHFERILVAFTVLVLLLGGSVYSRQAKTTRLLLLFFLWTIASHMLSPYRDITQSAHWFGNYWKILVFYFMVLFSIRKPEDLFGLFAGIVIISLFYQFHSWVDFLQGGNYVWQQGMKRMTGVWSGGGIGSANGWGFTVLFTLPFGIFWYKATGSRHVKLLMLFYFLISASSILASGTRAAAVVLIALLGFTFRKQLLQARFTVIGACLAIFAVLLIALPPQYKHRYFDLMFVDKTEATNRADEMALESAQGRIQGLKDGWALFTMRPLLGYGPATSSLARLEVNEEFWAADKRLKLHNLYGQILAEIGSGGAIVFLLIVMSYFRQLRKARQVEHPAWHPATVNNYVDTLQGLMLIMLAYGMFSHNLFDLGWLLLLACQAALIHLLSTDVAKRTMGWSRGQHGRLARPASS